MTQLVKNVKGFLSRGVAQGAHLSRPRKVTLLAQGSGAGMRDSAGFSYLSLFLESDVNTKSVG